MSASLYHDNQQNSAPTPGNKQTNAPTETLSHYGANFTPISMYVTSSYDTWPPTYGAGWQGPDNTAKPSLAGLPPNTDTPN